MNERDLSAREAREFYGIRECFNCGAPTQERGDICATCQAIGVRHPMDAHKCATPDCRRFTFNPEHCDACALEIAMLGRLIDYFPPVPGSELERSRRRRARPLLAAVFSLSSALGRLVKWAGSRGLI